VFLIIVPRGGTCGLDCADRTAGLRTGGQSRALEGGLWGIFNVLSFGALLVLLVIASYTGLVLAVVEAKL
jgi:hypothetical protein